MKTLFIALAIFATLPAQAQETEKPKDNSPREQMRRLLHEFPPQRALDRYRDIVARHEAPRDDSEREYARQKVKLAQELVPQIRALIKPGTSIFDYPGLLAAGSITDYRETRRITDDKTESRYEFYLGVFLGPEGTAPSEFRLRFDERGIITEFFTREWKH